MTAARPYPPKRETAIVASATLVFLLITWISVGLRPEHILMAVLFLGLFFASSASRKLAVGLLPFILFGISYDYMRVYPNYLANPIDVEGLYQLEKSLFGIQENGNRLIPCEYFALHNCQIADFFAGLFYLCWVPVPIAFGLWLYVKDRSLYLRYSMVFLFVNLIGFAGYYIHPAAPPWYAIQYGFEAVLNTSGNVAGLGRFDLLTGLPIFDALYGRNSNVFAAVPSLHSAYMVVTLCYAMIKGCSVAVITLFTIIMAGIWGTAVYSSHHYIIDVILGIGCACVGIVVFEKGLMKLTGFRLFFDRYYNYIRPAE